MARRLGALEGARFAGCLAAAEMRATSFGGFAAFCFLSLAFHSTSEMGCESNTGLEGEATRADHGVGGKIAIRSRTIHPHTNK